MAEQASVVPGKGLYEIFGGTKDDSRIYGCLVVVVADIGSLNTTVLWSNGASSWLETLLPKLLTKPCVLEFRHGIQEDDFFTWQQLVEAGERLFECLRSKACTDQVLPLYFISHGLGGIITKRALGILYERFYEQNIQKIISVLAGVIFLSSPHPTFDDTRQWAKLALTLQTHSKISRRHRDKLLKQIAVLANISQKFDESGIAVPILSAFEGKPTKITRGWIVAKRAVVVDESLARTKAKQEKLLQVEAQHRDICYLLPTHTLSTDLETFISCTLPLSAGPLEIGPTRTGQSLTGWTGSTSDDREGPIIEISGTGPKLTPQQTNLATAVSSNTSAFEIVPLKHGIAGISRAINLPCYLIKPHIPNPEFYARESVLQSIEDALSPSSATMGSGSLYGLKSFALCGPGGIGKTQIAVQYAYSAKKFFDVVFFLQADSTSKLAQGFSNISIQLNLETSFTTGDQVVSRDLVLEWLSKPFRSRTEGQKSDREERKPDPTWLLVFDNADDLSILRDYWPVAGNGSILITSRDPLAKTQTHVHCTNGTDLSPFTSKEAGIFLRELTGHNKTDDYAHSETVAEKLSCLPLALSQVARTINRRNLSFEEFLEFYDHDSSRLNIHQNGTGMGPKTLYTVWAFEDLSPVGLKLLGIISFLDPDRIPEYILRNIYDSNQKSILQQENYPASLQSFVDARTELTKSSLIKRDIDLKELEIHRIIQDAARLRMTSQDFFKTFDQAILIIFNAWPFSEFEHSTERWLICEPLVPHVSSLRNLWVHSEFFKGDSSSRPGFARLLMDVGWYHIERGNLDTSLAFLQVAQAICQIDPERCTITLADVHFCRSEIAILTNDIGPAMHHAMENLEILQKADPCGWRVPQGHNEAAEAYFAAGVYEEAVKEADLAINGYSQLPEPEYADWAQMNKAFSLCSISRYEDASQVIENYLQYREDTFGPTDTESFKTGLGLLILGKIRGCQGRLLECLDLYLKALAQYHSTIGPNHFRVAALEVILGDTYAALRDSENSRALYYKALETYKEKPAYMPQAALTNLKLSRLLSSMNLGKEAAVCRSRADQLLGRLSQKLKRNITEDGLEIMIPNWSK